MKFSGNLFKGLVLAVVSLLGLTIYVVFRPIPETSHLVSNGEVVYSEIIDFGSSNLKATETYLNLPVGIDEVVRVLREKFPTALVRESASGPLFVIPQIHSGRVQLLDFPETLIVIRQGKLIRDRNRFFIKPNTDSRYSHLQIRDYRQTSALESAFKWLGIQIGT